MYSNKANNDRSDQLPEEVRVGSRIRELRLKQGLSLRALAKRSGLNINTLSLVENGKSSPSVSTLHQLALALEVPIATFFEAESIQKRVVFTQAGKGPQASIGKTQMQNLGEDLAGKAVQPFVVNLKPRAGCGSRMIVHTGHEFVFCLHGSIHYQVDESDYYLKAGDSLVFESHLPHRWENHSEDAAEILLVLFSPDEHEETGGRHFSPETAMKELNMKIAVVTNDGKTISRHFGRAPYYLVLTIEEGKIIRQEMREKMGHNQFRSHHHEDDQQHGSNPEEHNRHVQMTNTIEDCSVLISGGMGMGAYESMRRLNIQPIVTDEQDINTAVQAYIDGKLVDHTELLH